MFPMTGGWSQPTIRTFQLPIDLVSQCYKVGQHPDVGVSDGGHGVAWGGPPPILGNGPTQADDGGKSRRRPLVLAA